MTTPQPNTIQEIDELLKLPHIQEFYDWCNEEDIDEDVMYKIAGWLGSEIYFVNANASLVLNKFISTAVREARESGILDGRLVERARWITPIQQKVLTEISACLSPRITDLIKNTGLGNSTVQKALTKLIEVGLVRKIDNIYHLAENSMYMCKYGCKDAGLHYHNEYAEAQLKDEQ